MYIKKLDTWADFEKIMKDQLLSEAEDPVRSGKYIYRGMPDAKWKLETSLERKVGENVGVENYYGMIRQNKEKIQTYTNQQWILPTYEDFLVNLKNRPSSMSTIDKEVYNYLAYLRHFGFPSPLLDWSFSPFVAAFFAFRDTSNNAEEVAIYANFIEHGAFGNNIREDVELFPLVGFAKNNKRHDIQQGCYTICLKMINDKVYFVSHEDPYLHDDRGHHSHFTKYILPARERVAALYNLEAYNINSFSLFANEESLLESLFLEKYVMAGRHKNIGMYDVNHIWF